MVTGCSSTNLQQSLKDVGLVYFVLMKPFVCANCAADDQEHLMAVSVKALDEGDKPIVIDELWCFACVLNKAQK